MSDFTKKRGGRNLGTSFERELIRAFGTYETNRIASVEKIDPPTQVLGGKIIFKQNPFPDFIGTWTERGGKMLAFEAKRTELPKLAVGGRSGLTANQLQALETWHASGAFSALLWQHKDEIRALTPRQIRALMAKTSLKHIKWEDAQILPKGIGWIRNDFLKWARSLTE